MRGLTSFLVVIGALALAATQAHAVDITECGQVVPAREVGNLVADLDCTDPNQFVWDAVALDRRATLNLNGFSLIGPGPEGAAGTTGVDCLAACRVNGPGTIIGFQEGIRGGHYRARITDVDIFGASDRGIDANNVLVIRCTVSGTRGWAAIRGAIYSKSKIKIVDSVISDNEQHGVTGYRVVVRDSVIVDNGFTCPPVPAYACYDIYVSKKASLRNTTYGTCKAKSGGKCRAR